MAKWGKINGRSELICELTDFPRTDLGLGERLSYTDRIVHNDLYVPNKTYAYEGDQEGYCSANFVRGLDNGRGYWIIQAAGSNDYEVREFVRKVIKKINLLK